MFITQLYITDTYLFFRPNIPNSISYHRVSNSLPLLFSLLYALVTQLLSFKGLYMHNHSPCGALPYLLIEVHSVFLKEAWHATVHGITESDTTWWLNNNSVFLNFSLQRQGLSLIHLSAQSWRTKPTPGHSSADVVWPMQRRTELWPPFFCRLYFY